MAIRACKGLPRQGKGVYSSGEMWKALTRSDICIITTLSIDLELLQAGCDKRCPKKRIHVPSRVKRITRQESQFFWRHRACRRTYTTDADGRKLLVSWEWPVVEGVYETVPGKAEPVCIAADLKADEERVFYILDEAHLTFSRRAYASFTKEATWYFSQHAHWGDEIIIITQVLDRVESTITDLVEETVEVTNYAKRGYLGLGVGKWFRVLKWWGVPSAGTVADHVSTMLLPDIIKEDGWYSSKGGIGIESKESGSPDADSDYKGIRWWVWSPVAVALLVALLVACIWGPRYVAKRLLGAGKSLSSVPARVVPVASPVVAAEPGPSPVGPARPMGPGVVSASAVPVLWAKAMGLGRAVLTNGEPVVLEAMSADARYGFAQGRLVKLIDN